MPVFSCLLAVRAKTDLRGHKAPRVPLALPVQSVMQGRRVRKVLPAHQGQLVPSVWRVPSDQLALPALWDLLVLLEKPDPRASQVLLVRKERKATKETRATQAPKATRASFFISG